METGQANYDSAFSDKAIRQGFIRKVYAILCCQLLITFTFIIITNKVDTIQQFMIDNVWLAIIAIVASFIIYIPLICVSQFRSFDSRTFLGIRLIVLPFFSNRLRV